jgi:hypothetical protein
MRFRSESARATDDALINQICAVPQFERFRHPMV